MFRRSPNETDLLKASLHGSPQAFGALVDRYASLICAITYGATGNVTESEELAQETFLRAWKNLPQLKDLGKFRPWLCRIARSTVQNWFRDRRHDVVGQAAPLEAAANETADKSEPVEAAMSHEQQIVVRQALARIPEQLREPLILFYREQQSTRQVAEQLGLSENAARQRISRARNLLRAQVAAMVENTIAQTKPGKAFTTAVIAALAGTAVRSTASAAVGMKASAAGSGFGVGTALSSVAGKVVLLTAGLSIIAATVWIHGRNTPTGNPNVVSQAVQPVSPAPSAATLATGSVDTSVPTVPDAEVESPAVKATSAPDAETGRAKAATPPETDAAPFEFKPQGVLSGLVTDIETGTPVSDALVRISRNWIVETRTDAHGFYSFNEIPETGNCEIAIDSKNYVGISLSQPNPVIALRENAQAVKHFQLPKACMFDLWVVDSNGVGIEGAKVVATVPTDADPRSVSYFGDLRQTDEHGHILLGGFLPSETDYLITAWHTVDLTVQELNGRRPVHRAYDFAPAHKLVRLNDTNIIPQVQIVLEHGEDISGYIRYADGVPASDLEVVARPAWWHCNYSMEGYPVDTDGTFTIKHITPGLYDLCAHVPPSDLGGATTSKIIQRQLPPVNGEPLLLQLPGKSPQSLASISGTLVFLGPTRPRYIDIDAYSPSAGHRLTSVGYGPDGKVVDTFLVDRLEPGTYRLRFSSGQIEEKIIEGVVAPTSGLEIEVIYTTKPILTGTVIDAETGAPVEAFQTRARKARTLRGSNYVQENQWAQFDNASGYFSMAVVGPGIYQVQVVAEGYAPTWSPEISTDANEPVEVALVRGRTITGRVINDEGKPLTGARVIPLSLASGTTPRTRDAFVSEHGAVETIDGKFTLRDLASGTETLNVMHPDYAPRLVPDIEVAEDRTTAAAEIVMIPGGTVEGFVYDGQGNPLPQEVLYFLDTRAYVGSVDDETGQLATTVTDSNGFYRVSHLPEQLCYIKRSNEWHSLGVVRRAVLPVNRTVTRLDFGGSPTVSGTVLLQGAPLAQERLLLGPVDSPYFGRFKCFTMTDEQGNFDFCGAAPGTHAIYREDPEKEGNWLRITAVAVEDADVNVGVLNAGTSQLHITLTTPGDATPWPIVRLLLCDLGRLFGESQIMGRAPAEAGQPWTFVNVQAGTYTLLAHRQDQIQWQTEITLGESQDSWELSVPIPESTSQVSGDIVGATDGVLMLWREDKLIFGAIRPDDDGNFALDGLPPGRYLIGSVLGFLYDVPALTEFHLAPHACQTVDLDLSVTPVDRMAQLIVHVVDENTITRDDATLYLHGPLGALEPITSTQIGHVFVTTPGRHRLVVEMPGYERIERDIALETTPTEGGAPRTLQIVMKPL